MKEIQDAMAIVSYEPDTVESKLGTLTYLGSSKSDRKNVPQYFVNLPLNNNLEQKSGIPIQRQLDYGVTLTDESLQSFKLKQKT